MPLHRRLPHLQPFAKQPIVFLTVVTRERKRCLAAKTPFETLSDIWSRSAQIDGWYVGDYLLMPDHVHLFARAAPDPKPLARWVGGWKSLSARRLKGKFEPPLWQRDYFDRILRSADDYSEKWDYVANNPVRKGLCVNRTDWPWRGRLYDLQW